MLAAVLFEFADDGFVGRQRERIAIDIFESDGNASRGLRLRRLKEADAAIPPFFVFAEDILGEECDLRGPADELPFFRARPWGDKRDHGSTVWRCDGEQTPGRRCLRIEGQFKSQLIHIKFQAALLIANEHTHGTETEIQIAPVGMKAAPVRMVVMARDAARGRAAHGWIIPFTAPRLYVFGSRMPTANSPVGNKIKAKAALNRSR